MPRHIYKRPVPLDENLRARYGITRLHKPSAASFSSTPKVAGESIIQNSPKRNKAEDNLMKFIRDELAIKKEEEGFLNY